MQKFYSCFIDSFILLPSIFSVQRNSRKPDVLFFTACLPSPLSHADFTAVLMKLQSSGLYNVPFKFRDSEAFLRSDSSNFLHLEEKAEKPSIFKQKHKFQVQYKGFRSLNFVHQLTYLQQLGFDPYFQRTVMLLIQHFQFSHRNTEVVFRR